MIRQLTEEERDWLRRKAQLWYTLHPEYPGTRVIDLPLCEDMNCLYVGHCSMNLVAEFVCPSVSHYFCFGFLWPKDKDLRIK